MVPAAESVGIPWQHAGNMDATGYGYKHVSQRGLFDMLKKKDMKGQPVSIVDMFVRMSCVEKTPSVFEPPESHYLELEQVGLVLVRACSCAFLFIHIHRICRWPSMYTVVSSRDALASYTIPTI